MAVNERAFQRLSDAQKKALLEAAATAEQRGWDLSRQREGAANKLLGDNGMTLHTPDAEMRAAFTKVGDTILAEWLKAAGADGEAIIAGFRKK